MTLREFGEVTLGSLMCVVVALTFVGGIICLCDYADRSAKEAAVRNLFASGFEPPKAAPPGDAGHWPIGPKENFPSGIIEGGFIPDGTLSGKLMSYTYRTPSVSPPTAVFSLSPAEQAILKDIIGQWGTPPVVTFGCPTYRAVWLAADERTLWVTTGTDSPVDGARRLWSTEKEETR